MSRTTTIRTLVVLCTGLLVPAAVAAQATSTQSAPPRSPAELSNDVTLTPKSQVSDWIAAARALERAAKLRAPGDPRVVNDLLGAATAYEAAGKLVQARKALVEGARKAAKTGNGLTAANAYVEAARLSIQLRDENGTFTYLEHARQLARSPGMTPEQTRVIFAQIGKI
jgi:hypothetical protein